MMTEQQPKTWYAAAFYDDYDGKTVLWDTYNKDELMAEAERRGAVKALHEVKAYILQMSVKAIKQYGGPEDQTDSWKISIGFNQAMAVLDASLSTLRAEQYEEREEIESFGSTKEDWH